MGGIARIIRESIGQLKRLARRDVALIAAIAGLVLAQALHVSAPLDSALSDWRMRAATRTPSQNLVVVEIDPASLRAAGRWPWPRSRFAEAIASLQSAGASLIGFDVDFSAQSNAAEDSALAHALADAPGMVVLPTFLQRGGQGENAPLAALSPDALIASVNVPIDPDGRARRYFRGFETPEGYRATMASTLAGAPYGESAPFLIDFGINVDRIDRLSFEDVRTGRFDAARVKGKAVLIGATALELGDSYATPTRAALPGVYVHAAAFDSLVQGRALSRLSGAMKALIALAVLLALWPRRAGASSKSVLIRHGGAAALILFLPLLLQMLFPVSIDTGLALMAQGLCALVAVQRELAFRKSELARQREAHLTHIAFHDPETQLPNRRAMLDDIARAKQDIGAGRVVVMALGVDRFATLRGAIGYANANEIMAQLAARLTQTSGVEAHHLSTSILGLVLRAADGEQAQSACEKIARGLDTSLHVAEQSMSVDVRVGWAEAGDDAFGPEVLLERAALALDHARVHNRRIVCFDPAVIADPKLQLALTSDIGVGLARGEFSLLYQPKVSSSARRVIGAEALMRWRHPVYGDMPTNRFIIAAEETGAIHELTLWAVRQAIEDQKQLRGEGCEIVLSVNLSARTLTSAASCQAIIAAVRAAKADLCLEITETAVIDDPDVALANISALREAGVKISIDDYGSGLSSLAYLKQIAADELKLDKLLMSNLTNNARDRLILNGAIELAHALGMSVVAEGVEDEDEFEIVSAMGCDAIQGYLFSRPIDIRALGLLCNSNSLAEHRRAAPD